MLILIALPGGSTAKSILAISNGDSFAERELQAAFDDIARQNELDELKKEIQELRKSYTLASAQDDLAAYEVDVNSAVMREAAPPPAPTVAPEAKPEIKDEAPPATPAKGDPA